MKMAKGYKYKNEIVADVFHEKKETKKRIWRNWYEKMSEGNKQKLKKHEKIYCKARQMFLYKISFRCIKQKRWVTNFLFGNIMIDKHKFPYPKNPTLIDNVGIDRIRFCLVKRVTNTLLVAKMEIMVIKLRHCW